jgi:hypothetical protein
MKAVTILFNRIWPNSRINSDWQFRYASLPAGYADSVMQLLAEP